MKRIVSIALISGVMLGYFAKPIVEEPTIIPAKMDKVVLDKQAVISALSTRSKIVGLTGKVEKTVKFVDNEWYGSKEMTLAATGSFQLGVDTSDLIITTKGNTVTVRFPQPKIISVDMPFDKAALKKDVGLLRKDLTEAELQAMYGKARESAVADIKRDRQAFDKAEESIERTIEKLLAPIPGAENIDVEGE